MGAIARNGSPLGEIIRHLGLSKQRAGQLVDTLVVRGYLDRTPDPDDRRRMTVALTDRGRLAARHGPGRVERIDAALTEQVGADAHRADARDPRRARGPRREHIASPAPSEDEEHLLVRRERPQVVGHHGFERVAGLAYRQRRGHHHVAEVTRFVEQRRAGWSWARAVSRSAIAAFSATSISLTSSSAALSNS